MAIITVDDAVAQLRIPADTDDDIAQIEAYCDGITAAVEAYLHEAVELRSVTEQLALCGASTFLITTQPVVSLTSIASADGATTYDVTGMYVSPDGVVRVLTGTNPTGLVTATYQAGYETVPDNIVRGALVILQHVWETQRGVGSVAAGVIGTEETFDPRFSYSIPRKALEWLGAPRPVLA